MRFGLRVLGCERIRPRVWQLLGLGLSLGFHLRFRLGFVWADSKGLGLFWADKSI